MTSVQSYLAAFKSEFDTTVIDSGFPYRQRHASMDFRRITKMNAWEVSERFEDKGKGCWGFDDDDIVNEITADLLAAVELLGGRIQNRRLSGSPGGIGCDTTALCYSGFLSLNPAAVCSCRFFQSDNNRLALIGGIISAGLSRSRPVTLKANSLRNGRMCATAM